MLVIDALRSGNLGDIRVSFSGFSTPAKNTYHFPVKQVILSFAAIPFEPRTHVHARPYHSDSFVEALRDQRVVHLAFCYSLLSLRLAGSNELEQCAREPGFLGILRGDYGQGLTS